MRFVSDLFVATAWLVWSFPRRPWVADISSYFGWATARLWSPWQTDYVILAWLGLGTDRILAVSAISKINDLYFTVKDFPLHLQDWHMHI